MLVNQLVSVDNSLPAIGGNVWLIQYIFSILLLVRYSPTNPQQTRIKQLSTSYTPCVWVSDLKPFPRTLFLKWRNSETEHCGQHLAYSHTRLPRKWERNLVNRQLGDVRRYPGRTRVFFNYDSTYHWSYERFLPLNIVAGCFCQAGASVWL